MSQYTGAVAVLQKFAAAYKPLVDLADSLIQFDSLEQAAREAEDRTRAAQRGEGAAVEARQAAESDFKKITEEAADAMANAEEAKRVLLWQADQQAGGIVAAARDSAAALKQDAQDAMDAAEAAARQTLAGLQQDIEAASTQQAAAVAGAVEAQKTLDALNEQIVIVRNAAASILAGA